MRVRIRVNLGCFVWVLFALGIYAIAKLIGVL